MYLKVLKIVLIIQTIFVMGFIFRMSAMNAKKSSDLSDSVGYKVGELTIKNFKKLPKKKKKAYVKKIQHPLRKLAHFTEFTALGFLFLLDVRVFLGFYGIKNFITALLSGLFYAGTDEIHQLVVSGRSGEFLDVMIDFSGVLLGCLIATLCLFIISRIKINETESIGRKMFGI